MIPAAASGELLQEAEIVLEKDADVVDAMAQHRDAVESEAPRPAGEFFRIVACRAEHVRVDHPAAAHLEPARAFARAAARAVARVARNVDFGGRFGELEIRRAEPRASICAEEMPAEIGRKAFEMAERDAAID